MHRATNASVLEHIFDRSRITCASSGFPEFVVNVFAAAVSISGWLMQFQAIFDIWLPPILYTTRAFVSQSCIFCVSSGVSVFIALLLDKTKMVEIHWNYREAGKDRKP